MERMDMHLVWTTGRMFLNPIPRFVIKLWWLFAEAEVGHHCSACWFHSKVQPLAENQKVRDDVVALGARSRA